MSSKIEGKNTIAEGIDDIKYDLKPKAFYQLNPEQAIKLYKEVKNNINYYKKQRYMLQNDTPWGRSDIRQKISRSLESGNRLDFWPGKLISKELLTPVTFVVFSAP